jgi:hypothetical protein
VFNVEGSHGDPWEVSFFSLILFSSKKKLKVLLHPHVNSILCEEIKAGDLTFEECLFYSMPR